LESLFGVHETPSTNQIKNILDLMPPKEIGDIFWTVYEELNKATEHIKNIHRKGRNAPWVMI